MAEKQKTIAKSVSLSGKGLHTATEVKITFNPAPENHGYKFRRTDLEGKPIINALAENVIDTSRSTVLSEKNVRIATVEHVLSAVYGLGIDNILIDLTGQETPILDGSAALYVKALQEAGIVEQNADRKYFVIKDNIKYTDEKSGIELEAFPNNELSINVMIDYNSSVLGNQYAVLNSLKNYAEEISSCKTFVFFKELEILLKNNLIKGGDLQNALVIIEKEINQDELDRMADLFNKPRKKYSGQAILNEQDLIFHNEPARHKLLDLIGDLALCGMAVKGKILATRPGHYSNVQFVKKIRQEIKRRNNKNTAPDVDIYATPIFDINGVMKKLPHRPPFLLIDKILEQTNTVTVGLKNVTINETFFNGHFPGKPVMPGVLIIEAMAQTGGMLVLNTVEDPENYLTYFLKIDKVKFRKMVCPGDTIIFRLELIAPIRRGIANMKAQAFVGKNLVAEGELMAQIVKEK